jgi:TnpA family transposase
MLVGHLAEKQSAKLAQQSVDELVRLIASGGLPKQTAQSILQRLAASKRAAVLAGLGRAGMGFGAAAANQLYRANSQNEAANP